MLAGWLLCGSTLWAQDPTALNEQLISAVQNEDINAAQVLLAQGATPSGQVSYTWNRRRLIGGYRSGTSSYSAMEVLTKAECTADSGRLYPFLDLFLEHGANLNAATSRKAPLQSAVEGGCPKLVGYLLEHGANPSRPDPFQRQPLYYAIKENHYSVAEMLLDAGAKPDAESLHLAVKDGNLQGVTLLLDAGASVDALNVWERSPLFTAIKNNQPSAMELLIERGASLTLRDRSGETPLDLVRKSGSAEMVRLLGANDSDPILMGSLLHEAVEARNISEARRLLEAGADPNFVRDNPPLHHAAESNNVDLVNLLLDHGANIDAPGSFFDETALMEATSGCSDAAVLVLLDRGADVNAHEDSILSRAGRCQIATIQRLIDAGANPAEIELSLFSSSASPEALALVAGLGADLNQTRRSSGETQLHHCISFSKEDDLQALLAAGADPNIRDHDGQTPLHFAVEHVNTEAITILLDASAKPNLADHQGNTALHLAAKAPSRFSSRPQDLVSMLLQHNADPNTLNNDGQSPLFLSGNVVVTRILISAGADPSITDHFGKTAAETVSDPEAKALLSGL